MKGYVGEPGVREGDEMGDERTGVDDKDAQQDVVMLGLQEEKHCRDDVGDDEDLMQ